MIEELNGENLRIAVQNVGRLTARSTELLRGVGLEFEDHDRRLFSRCRGLPVELLFVRDDDIPEYVQDGVAELGIVGQNVVWEMEAEVRELEELPFGRCTLTVAVPDDSAAAGPADLEGARIATTHPRSLRRYLEGEGLEARVIPIRGAAEIAPALDVADGVCDLVSTGTTMQMHDLRPVAEVWTSRAALVAHPPALDGGERAKLVERLRTRVRGLLTARRMKYVTLNAPRAALPEIQQILPGMRSPTVVPLAREGMVALHAAVEEEVFWDAMEAVRAAGGTEILVLPVEKVLR